MIERPNCGKICAISPRENMAKEFINIVAEKFSGLIRGKEHRINTETLGEEKKKGKLDVIQMVKDYLYEACPKDFRGGNEGRNRNRA